MNRSLLDNASLTLLSQQSTNNLIWMTVPPVAFVTNLLSMLTIAFSKTLHKKSQFVIFSFLLVDALQLMAYFLLGLLRYTAFLREEPQTSSQLSCQIQQYPLTLASVLVKYMAFVLALDRLCCVAMPIFHRNLNGRKYVSLINVSIWLVSIASVSMGFLRHDDKAFFAVCAFSTCFDAVFVSFVTIQGNVVTILTATTYVLAILVLYARYRKMKKNVQPSTLNTNQMNEWRTRMDLNAFVVVSIIGSIYLALAGLNTILSSINRFFAIEARLIFAGVISTLSFVNSMSHFFVFLIFNSLFREAFVRSARKMLFLKCPNAVHPAS